MEAGWKLVVERRRIDVGVAEIAAAGVSRQSVYLGFRSRAGLLVAMARHADARSPHAARMRAISEGGADDPDALIGYVREWLRHLPGIYPVGVLLGAAAVTDPEAATAFPDRMVGAPHARYVVILERLDAAGNLAPGWQPLRAADRCWSLTHVDARRQLVVERGWRPEAFEADRLALIRTTLRPRG